MELGFGLCDERSTLKFRIGVEGTPDAHCQPGSHYLGGVFDTDGVTGLHLQPLGDSSLPFPDLGRGIIPDHSGVVSHLGWMEEVEQVVTITP